MIVGRGRLEWTLRKPKVTTPHPPPPVPPLPRASAAPALQIEPYYRATPTGRHDTAVQVAWSAAGTSCQRKWPRRSCSGSSRAWTRRCYPGCACPSCAGASLLADAVHVVRNSNHEALSTRPQCKSARGPLSYAVQFSDLSILLFKQGPSCLLNDGLTCSAPADAGS